MSFAARSAPPSCSRLNLLDLVRQLTERFDIVRETKVLSELRVIMRANHNTVT